MTVKTRKRHEKKDKVLSVRGVKSQIPQGTNTNEVKFKREVSSRVSCKTVCKKTGDK